MRIVIWAYSSEGLPPRNFLIRGGNAARATCGGDELSISRLTPTRVLPRHQAAPRPRFSTRAGHAPIARAPFAAPGSIGSSIACFGSVMSVLDLNDFREQISCHL